MPGCSLRALPYSALCNDMLVMLVCATCWLYMHLYTLTHMFMHKSCLIVCRPCFNTMKSWKFDLNLHFSLTNTTSCLLSRLFACFLACLLAFLFLCLPCLSRLSALCLFHTLFAPFFSIACLLVSYLCLCMYTHESRMHGARVQFPRCKQKGCRCKYVDMSQAAMFSRVRSLAFPFGYILF